VDTDRRMEQLALSIELRIEADFAEYLPGPNAEAIAAVAGWAIGNGHDFLYLFGPSGTGKTHLLQAACRSATDLGTAAVYLPLGQPGLEPEVLDELERADLVALDDLQSVAGQEQWEHALFGLYNRLREAGRRLLVSANKPAAEMPIKLPDLRSRLAWGPGYRLRPLAEADCERLLLQSARRRGLQLGNDAVNYILRRCPREPRHLLALLDKLDKATLSRKRRPTLPLIRELLQPPEP